MTLRATLLPLLALHGLLLLSEFFGPFDPAQQHRDVPFAPPTRLHFVDTEGALHLRPFVYAIASPPGALDAYEEDRSRRYPLRLFVECPEYRLAGLLPARHRLFGVDAPGRMFVLGTDGFGRDQLSRLLHGGRLSLFAGLLAATVSLGLGLVLGTLAGFYGGWQDALLMRLSELFLALPWLYLLLAARAFLPLHLEPAEALGLLVVLIGLIDWARPSRLIRGVALSAREREYVAAARAFGASDAYLMRRHVMPQALGVVWTQAALLVPQYVLAEVTLSFLGLGVSDPVPSWGNMLTALQRYHVLSSYWWMWLPGLALVPVFLAYFALSEALHARVGPAAP
jgi:peptide/nickel transport system permease protein